MKTIYWQAHNLPRMILIVFCLFILAGLVLVEKVKKTKPQAYHQQKLEATQLAQQGMDAIKNIRSAKKLAISAKFDPQGSGLIGYPTSSITTDSSTLSIKQTTINPNMAALFVEWLKKTKLKSGDIVAVNMTGSFPALDISMLAAIKTLKLKPLITYSAAASNYGANIPYFSWTDMYHGLSKKKIFTYPVLGISIGGKRDHGYAMSSSGIGILQRTIQQYNYPFIDSKNTIDGINKRMALYEQHSDDKPIAAFINVGGNMASIGLKQIKTSKNGPTLKNLKPRSISTGVVDKLPINLINTDSVAVRFLKQGVPVVNVHNISKNLIEKYNFPISPKTPVAIGTSRLFYQSEYITWLAILVLSIDIAAFVLLTFYSKKYVIRYKQ